MTTNRFADLRPGTLFLMLGMAVSLAGAAPVAAQNPGTEAQARPEPREMIEEMHRAREESRQMLKELAALLAAAESETEAAQVQGQLQVQKAAMEIRMIEIRLQYARRSGRQDQILELEPLLKALKLANQFPVSPTNSAEDPTISSTPKDIK